MADQRKIQEDLYGEFSKSLYRKKDSYVATGTYGRTVGNVQTGIIDGRLIENQSIENKTINMENRTVTLVVNNSGGGDYATIKEALDYVTQKNLKGTIFIRAGTYYEKSDLVIPSGINLVGDGREITIIDFGIGNFSISSSRSNHIIVKNLSIKRWNGKNVLSFVSCNYLTINSILFNNLIASDTYGSGNAIYLESCSYFTISNVLVSEVGSTGIEICGKDSTGGCSYGMVIETTIEDVDSYGIKLWHIEDSVTLDSPNYNIQFINCFVDDTGSDGIYVGGDAAWNGTAWIKFIGCTVQDSAYNINIVDSNSVSFIGCDWESGRAGSGVLRISGNSSNIFGVGNRGGIDDNTTGLHNSFLSHCSTWWGYENLPAFDETTDIEGVTGFTSVTERIIRNAYNKTGSTLSLGTVVCLTSVADGDEIATTTTRGDTKVYGMVAESILDNWVGSVLLSGITHSLKVNGTDDIAIGDFLSTYTTAGIACKAQLGDMVFAIALEAYSANDSNGVIDAYLLPYHFPLLSSSTLSSGVYTPTRSAETNLDGNVTPSEAQYARIGNTVTVSGRFTADPTLAATATSFELTLPIASNIGAVEDAAGVAFCGGIAGQGAEVTGSIANNTAVISWVSGDVTSKTWSYVFTYQII